MLKFIYRTLKISLVIDNYPRVNIGFLTDIFQKGGSAMLFVACIIVICLVAYVIGNAIWGSLG
ncbi:MAG: hypothetical protein US98_C0030G0005 [Parcubacteria group bacterium GW2011_GWC1_38_6]|nr:MAG: hypothetical protein US98_C0030G0005 [Parcubacteria group bacterium GW2011_GWC1_38_6]